MNQNRQIAIMILNTYVYCDALTYISDAQHTLIESSKIHQLRPLKAGDTNS